MLPTFNIAGDLVLVDKVFWKLFDIEFGSVLVFISPVDPDRLVMKRVLGRPGDLVLVDPTKSTNKIKVPPNHLWMQGDNYPFSNDSRFYGPIPIGLVQGRIVCQLYPRVRSLFTGAELVSSSSCD